MWSRKERKRSSKLETSWGFDRFLHLSHPVKISKITKIQKLSKEFVIYWWRWYAYELSYSQYFIIVLPQQQRQRI